jgi:LmbE family N-acetylglucosaminyl deacetylase
MRRVLALGAVCALLACLSAGPVDSRAHAGGQVALVGVQPAAAARDGFMEIVAHPDDSLLFMNPDLHSEIASGVNVMTVVLTSAEGRAGIKDGHDPAEYVAARHLGLQASYAAMAGVPNSWGTSTLHIDGASLLLRTLTAQPHVRLVYLSLPDGLDPRSNLRLRSLTQLYADTSNRKCAWTTLSELPPFCYTHRDVVNVLAGLMRQFPEPVVLAQDPYPDARYWGDHPDHVAAARFADAAVRASGNRTVQVNYRDYNVSFTPVNLGGIPLLNKQQVFQLYAGYDYRVHIDEANYASWQKRMRYRWGRGVQWIDRGSDGKLRAYVVLSGQLYVWSQTAAGWDGPALVGSPPGGPLAQTLSVGGGEVLGFQPALNRLVSGRPHQVAGRWAVSWQSLGAPSLGYANRLGTPVLTYQDGRPVVVVRNGAGGVSVKCGSGAWQTLPMSGRGVQDGVAAVGGPGGLDIFGPTVKSILHWKQTGPCRFGYQGEIPNAHPGGPLTAARTSSGRPTVFYQEGGGLSIAEVTETGTTWSRPAAPAGAVISTLDERPEPVGGYSVPAPLGAASIGVPEVVTDASGHGMALVLGADGRLHVSTRGSWGMFGPWQVVGAAM